MMNTGQTTLGLLGMMLLSTLTLNINASILNASTFGFQTEVNLNAISVA